MLIAGWANKAWDEDSDEGSEDEREIGPDEIQESSKVEDSSKRE